MYPHKSEWMKRQERMSRDARQNKGQAGLQTLFLFGLLQSNALQTEDSPNLSVSKELEESGRKPDSSVSSVGAKINMIPLSDGSRTWGDLHIDRSESTNAKSVTCLDIGCITDEGPIQAEIEKRITIGDIPLPKQFTFDLDKQSFPEITLKKKIILKNEWRNEQERASCLVSWKQTLCCLPCWMFRHTTDKVSSRSALASAWGWTAGTKWRQLGVRVR